MTRRRRQAAGLLAAVLGLVPAGCHRLPFHRVDPSLDPRGLGRVGREPPVEPPPALLADAGSGVPLPPLPLEPLTDVEALGEPTETPLLDAALVRAQVQQDVVVSSEVPDVDPAVVRAEVEVPVPDDPLPGPIRPRLNPVPEAKPPDPPAEPSPGPMETQPLDSAEEPESEAPVEPSASGEVLPSQEPPSEGPRADPAKDVRREPADEPSRSVPALAIHELRLCRRVLGFGRFEAIDGESLRPGQVIVLYCELAGLRYEQHGEGARSEIEATVEVLPESSDAPLWRRTLGVAEDICRRPRQDYYVNFRLALPDSATIPPGTYRLRLTQRDRLAGTEATRDLAFLVGEPAR